LSNTREQAMQSPDHEVVPLLLKFQQSVRGLTVGAPVDFRGIVIGDVTSIGMEYDAPRKDFNMLVSIPHLPPSRLLSFITQSDRGKTAPAETGQDGGARHAGAAAFGQLAHRPAVCGAGFLPRCQAAQLLHRQGMDVLLTIPGDTEELQGVLQRIARKLDKVPFDSIGEELDGTIKELHATEYSAAAG
jgi:paraquat-inducible protein B